MPSPDRKNSTGKIVLKMIPCRNSTVNDCWLIGANSLYSPRSCRKLLATAMPFIASWMALFTRAVERCARCVLSRATLRNSVATSHTTGVIPSATVAR